MKFLFVASSVLITLIGCKSTNHIVTTNDVKDDVENTIEGHWTLIKTETIEEKQSIEKFVAFAEPDIIREWTPPVYKDKNGVLKPHSQTSYFAEILKDLVISEDSIFGMNYPLELLQRNSYKIESNLIQVGNDSIKKSIELNSNKDTLRFSYLDNYGLYVEEVYIKATFDKSILNILKLYKTNLPLLAGTWKLVRYEGYEYGGYYSLDFPYDIPDTLVLTKKELETTLYTDRSYKMQTNGKKQPYLLSYYDSKLWLTPGHWYKDVNPSIRFERVEKE